MTPKVDGKLKAMGELLLCKEDGFAKVQRAVDLAQTVLANTDAKGHDQGPNSMHLEMAL